MFTLNDDILSSIENNGIYKIPNFLSKKDLNLLKDEGFKLIKGNYPFCRYSKTNLKDKTVLCNIVPSRVEKYQEWSKVKQIKKLSNSKLISSIAEKYVGKANIISNIIFDYSEIKNKELFDLHFDDFKGYKCLKAYFYLEDCYRENGAFRYIPGTHKLSRKFIQLVNKYDSNNYKEIIRCKNKKFLNHIKNDTHAYKAYNLLEKISKNHNLSYDYCVEGKAGTLLLFDTTGIHGGVELKKGKRYISRIHFVEKKFNKIINPNFLDRIFLKINRFINKP
jgi:ectoine hydroxylase-related dioxygenase (phytanoyl-CoA dioxygenase family)